MISSLQLTISLFIKQDLNAKLIFSLQVDSAFKEFVFECRDNSYKPWRLGVKLNCDFQLHKAGGRQELIPDLVKGGHRDFREMCPRLGTALSKQRKTPGALVQLWRARTNSRGGSDLP